LFDNNYIKKFLKNMERRKRSWTKNTKRERKTKFDCYFYFFFYLCSHFSHLFLNLISNHLINDRWCLAQAEMLCAYHWNNMTRLYISGQCHRHTKNPVSIRSISCSSFQPQLRILRRMSERVFFMFGNHVGIIWILQNKKKAKI